MRKTLASATAVLIVTAILVFSGCRKDSASFSKPAGPEVTTDKSSDLVFTPGGWIERSKVHFIPPGFHVIVQEGRLKRVETKTGQIVEDLGAYDIPGRSSGIGEYPFALDQPEGAKNSNFPYPNGWIAWTSWINADSAKNPVTSFSTTWTVPTNPTTTTPQLIYLFNGMQAGTGTSRYIVQPVLQWGVSPAGGGAYWAITNWFVTSGGSALHGSLVRVNAGTRLTGIISFLSAAGGNYIYRSIFSGYPDSTSILTPPVIQATELDEALESTGITTPNTQYPPDSLVRMMGILISEGTINPTLTWTPQRSADTTVTQRAVVISNSSTNGEVDIRFR
jgi:hypothetical protein